MKVLVAGKGGAGKTTLAAVLARTLARRGLEVTAIDGDSNPNLAIALGLGEDYRGVRSIRNELGGKSDAHAIEHLTRDFGVLCPDGVRLMQTGEVKKPSEGCLCCGSHMTFRDVYGRLESGGNHWVVADLEAGVNDVLWAYPKPGDAMVIVTDPSMKSLEVGKRLRAVAGDLGLDTVIVVANQAETEGDLERAAAAFPGLTVVRVPDDAEVRRADRDGLSPLDSAPGCAGTLALASIADRLSATLPDPARPMP